MEVGVPQAEKTAYTKAPSYEPTGQNQLFTADKE